MATRSRTSFQKRQKEIARMEKQRDKAAKRLARKAMQGQHQPDDDLESLEPRDEGAQPDGEEVRSAE